MADNYDSVLTQLRDAGLVVDAGLRVNGRITRCKVEGDREKRGWYCLHEITTSAGESLIVGSFGAWHGSDNGAQKIELDKTRELTADQRAAIRKRLDDDRRQADRDRQALARKAAARATAAWQRLAVEGESKYLSSKGVIGHGVRYSARGAIAIPVQDAAGRIHGLEIIRDKASAEAARRPAKEYWPGGMVVKGHFFMIGPPGWLIVIAEGYATAASIFEATGHCAVVAFAANNLVPVALELRKRYPNAQILLAADDDALAKCINCREPVHLEQHPKDCPACGHAHRRENAGVTSASAAALAISGAWVRPVFDDASARWDAFARLGRKRTDFNDLHALEGLASVRGQIEAKLSDLHWGPRTAQRVQLDQRGTGSDEPLRPIVTYEEVSGRFSLVYGMGGVVFDAFEHQLVSLSDMRDACVRKDVYRAWQENPDRRIVRIREIGFDPTERDGAVRCNLWAGWPTQPQSGRCERLLELLRYMCSGDRHAATLYDWLLKWLAYPLQHPGAKMKSTVVLHGPQGTGKNLFFEAVMGIYGRYGSVINQDAIEDKFNDWASRKLFLIADEVVARSDLYHVKNKLKAFITGDRLRINPKNMAAYEETNHVNLVFLSNEIMPVVLEEDDRRHCVVWTPEKLEKAFYESVLAEIDQGGIEALHHHLLHLDLGDFGRGTEPPGSDAKAELIHQSLDSTSRFWYALERGDLVPGKLGPVLSKDVYRLYRGYCGGEGIKAAPLPKLINILKRKHGVSDARKRYFRGPVQVGPAGVLYLGDLEQPTGQSEPEWIGQCVEAFSKAVSDYLGGADRD